MAVRRPVAKAVATRQLACAAAARSLLDHHAAGPAFAAPISSARTPAARRQQRRNLAVRFEKRITQSQFTEKAWQAIIAAPQVRTFMSLAHQLHCTGAFRWAADGLAAPWCFWKIPE